MQCLPTVMPYSACLKLFKSVYVILLMIPYTAYYCLLCLLLDDISNIGIIFHHFLCVS